ncbi:hypothetical protein E2C01_081174 [Portunus trituberculatus]|uniref:Uncharacterized protein n=1 Tax=Portunus trituberculatus TaxID=210409 RepID=A0A5B7IP46_PORTR|nr:hypothetical protein [Portunus trituberculatus]
MMADGEREINTRSTVDATVINLSGSGHEGFTPRFKGPLTGYKKTHNLLAGRSSVMIVARNKMTSVSFSVNHLAAPDGTDRTFGNGCDGADGCRLVYG